MSGNYYGFTSGGTQYGSVGTYPVTQAAYGATAPGTTGTASGYPMAAYNAAYGYTTGPASGTGGAQTGTTQNATGAMTGYAYGTQGTATNAASGYYATPMATGTYQAASSGTASGGAVGNYSGSSANSAAGASAGQQQQQQQTKTSTTSGDSTYSGYDAALYAAAKSYLASKTVSGNAGASQWMSMKKTTGASGGGGGGISAGSGTALGGSGGGGGRFGGGGRGSFPRRGGGSGGGMGGGGGGNYGQSGNYRQNMQMHYCETCKISCGALQTYREHLEGKMHKKKEALAKSGPTNPAKSKSSFYCEVCEILCTGSDTYQSHVKGSKHQKTLRLHQQMGKPMPSQEAKVLPPAVSANGQEPKKVVVVQKTNFVGGEKLTSTGILKSEGPQTEYSVDSIVGDEKEIQPVGEEYLEVIKIEGGRVTAYNCKLCDCRFTDLGAKDMHMKGRRHRLNYKKKVNPDLEVEFKPTPKHRRGHDEKNRREIIRMRQQDIYTMRAMYQSQITNPNIFGNMFGNFQRPGKAQRDTDDDRYIMAKHTAIYPTNEECTAAMKLVAASEKALKLVSDHFADEDRKTKTEEQKLAEIGNEERLLKGVMRVGDLAKQLLLKGDFRLELVVLCSERPTETLLHKVVQLLPTRFDNGNEDKYEVNMATADSALLIKTSREPYYELKVTFTSVAVRDAEPGVETSKAPEPLDVLDKQKCLEALASLRHAKWFQARCASLQFCLIVLRILKDLRQRIPAWMPLSSWASELLVEKVLNSSQLPAQPAEAFRRFFEAIASGLLMKCGPGLLDPCEKNPSDVLAILTPQQREDITASAQHMLRLISFKQVHLILGIEKSEVNGAGPRKRPLDTDVEMTGQESNGKKDKKGF